jgi:hypothetical protein
LKWNASSPLAAAARMARQSTTAISFAIAVFTEGSLPKCADTKLKRVF